MFQVGEILVCVKANEVGALENDCEYILLAERKSLISGKDIIDVQLVGSSKIVKGVFPWRFEKKRKNNGGLI